MASNYSQKSNSSGSSDSRRASHGDKDRDLRLSRRHAGRYAASGKPDQGLFEERLTRSKGSMTTTSSSRAKTSKGSLSSTESTGRRKTVKMQTQAPRGIQPQRTREDVAKRSSASSSRMRNSTSAASTSSKGRSSVNTGRSRGHDTGRPVTPQRGRQVGEIRAQEHREAAAQSRRFLVRRLTAICFVLVALIVGVIILYNSPLFTITDFEVQGSDYLTSDEVITMAEVPQDDTLLRVNGKDIISKLISDPFISSAQIHRRFPHTLVIAVTERTMETSVEVPVNSKSDTKTHWALAADGTWLAEIDDSLLETTSSATGDTTADTTTDTQTDTTTDTTADTTTDTQTDTEASTDGSADQSTDVTVSDDQQTAGWSFVSSSRARVSVPIQTAQVKTGQTPYALAEDTTEPTGSTTRTTDGTAATSDTTASSTATTSEETLAKRLATDAENRYVITNVSTSVVPETGTKVTDEGITNALAIMSALSADLRDQVISISAPNAEQTTLLLSNGVTVAFGSVSDAQEKERVVLQLLSDHEGAISYINVRVVDRPAWRGV